MDTKKKKERSKSREYLEKSIKKEVRLNKIQEMVVKYILDKGKIELKLPDGMVIEAGILQENETGDLVKTENYCWSIVSQKNRTVYLDSYNYGLNYPNDNSKMVIENESIDHNGKEIKIISVV